MIPVYWASVPITSYLTRTNGFFSTKIVPVLFKTTNALSTRGTLIDEPARVVALLALAYTGMTYVISGVGSFTGQTMGNPEGYVNAGIFIPCSVPDTFFNPKKRMCRTPNEEVSAYRCFWKTRFCARRTP